MWVGAFSGLAVSAIMPLGGRLSAAFVCALSVVVMSFIVAQPTSADPPADRIRVIERLVNAVASRNKAPETDRRKKFCLPSVLR